MTRRRIDITNIVEVLMSDNIHRTAAAVSEGQIVELEITDMTDDGKGLGRRAEIGRASCRERV